MSDGMRNRDGTRHGRGQPVREPDGPLAPGRLRPPLNRIARILLGEALILDTYCPDKLEQFRDKFDDYKVDDTIKD